MARVKLTTRGVEALTTEKLQEDVWDELLDGFGVRVGASGAKTYFVRYRANGKQRRLTIGRHPVLALAAARDKARAVLVAAQGGDDPALERQVRKSTDVTFAALATEVMESKAESTRERTRRARKQILAAELLPEWRRRPAASITRRDVVLLVEKIARRGAPVLANRTLSLIKLLFNEAVEREFAGIENNPAQRVRPPGTEGVRDRYFSRKELKELWKALEPESGTIRGFIKLAFLTTQRGHSVASMQWKDVDAEAGLWRIPAESFKGGRDHLVPLSSEALEMLAELRPAESKPSGYIFRSTRSDGRAPHFASWNPAVRRLRERMDVTDWGLHDARRSFRTWVIRPVAPADARDPAGCGIDPRVADSCLGHLDPLLGTRRYQGDKLTFLLAEKRDALERWGRFVRDAVEAKE